MDKSRLEIHFGWLFFAWHRFFYFHEHILAKLLDDDTFALPFWNWDNQSTNPPLANVLPYAFANKKYQNKSS
jgi:polyphenol oxidase